MAKVIITDSLGRDSVHDELYRDNLTDEAAEKLAYRYNDRRLVGSLRLAKVVSDDYELK